MNEYLCHRQKKVMHNFVTAEGQDWMEGISPSSQSQNDAEVRIIQYFMFTRHKLPSLNQSWEEGKGVKESFGAQENRKTIVYEIKFEFLGLDVQAGSLKKSLPPYPGACHKMFIRILFVLKG